MSPPIQSLSSPAGHHRHGRNIATHPAGIPMIVAAVAVRLPRPQWALLAGSHGGRA